MNHEWVSIIEYAKTHNISDMTVRRRIRSGKLTAELKDGKYFIKCDLSSSFDDKSSSNVKVPSNFPTSMEKAHLEEKEPNTYMKRVQQASTSVYPSYLEQRKPSSSLVSDSISQKKILEELQKLQTLIEEKNKIYVDSLKKEITLKDEKINFLNEKIEDLELLISILENPSS